MAERVTVQGKTGRSATTNPLDEGIDPYQSIGWTMQSGTGIVISQRAPLDLLCENVMKEMTVPIPFAGSQSSTKRVRSPLSSTAPMKSVESCSHGAAGNIWCPNKVSTILKTAPGLVVIFVKKSQRGGHLTSLVNSAFGAPYASLAVRIHEF
jgi:hypothetical protein